jgi:anaphase-promoting complex subunit 8
MTLIFLIYARQELYQCSDQEHSQLNDLENIFPENHFLMTQRALLYYHSKGQSSPLPHLSPHP